jgi:N-acetyl-anhydromuramyl-L-alanine amidase AmpD
MVINKEFINSRNCYKGENNPKYIVNHETDNYDEGAGARKHAMAEYNGNLGEVSVHFYVDDKEIYQCLELEDGAWAVGDPGNRGIITNRNSVNIEICVNPDSDFYEARKNAAWLNSYLLNLYNFNMNMVKRHYDATGKICPRQMINNPKLWNEFLSFIDPYNKQSCNVENSSNLSRIDRGRIFVGDRCRELQEKLIEKGYDCGECGADGIFGEGTLNALLMFQKDSGLEEDGLAGEETFKKLESNTSTENREVVRELQEELNKQGYGPVVVDGISGEETLNHCPTVCEGAAGNITKCIQLLIRNLGYNINIDGCFGEQTKELVCHIQEGNNLLVDGVVGRNTWTVLL